MGCTPVGIEIKSSFKYKLILLYCFKFTLALQKITLSVIMTGYRHDFKPLVNQAIKHRKTNVKTFRPV